MNKRRVARIGVASLTVGLCAAAIKQTYDDFGQERPPVDQDLLKKVVIGASLLSGLAVVTAAL